MTPIPEWVYENVVFASGVMCPLCDGLETRSWYSAANQNQGEWLLSIHATCKTAWIR